MEESGGKDTATAVSYEIAVALRSSIFLLNVAVSSHPEQSAVNLNGYTFSSNLCALIVANDKHKQI